ncbi:MAG: hypothetical protein ACM3JE_01005 [Betaproteobacteria bacterium]
MAISAKHILLNIRFTADPKTDKILKIDAETDMFISKSIVLVTAHSRK